MSYQNLKDWRKRTKLRAIEAMGGKCNICGYNKCYTAMEFHHIDPNEKEFSISQGDPKRWELFVEELKKCVLLCNRCHREVHTGMAQVPEDYKRFDENYFELPERKPKMDSCPVCGETKLAFKNTCSWKCRAKIREKVDWDNVDLKSMLRNGLTYTKIGEMIGCSNVAVKKRAKKLGLVV